MDKDMKEGLDGLALKLQVESVKRQEKGRPQYMIGAVGNSFDEGKGILDALEEINKTFGTNYESSSDKLKEYFKAPEKPCERQPSAEAKPIIIEGREEPPRHGCEMA